MGKGAEAERISGAGIIQFCPSGASGCKDVLEFLDYVDGGILSYQEKTIKPEPEIYRRLLERYHLVPEECVFLDDLEANLAAAAQFGIKIIHFTDRDSAVEEMKKLGIE